MTVAVARQDDPEGYEPVSAYSVLEKFENESLGNWATPPPVSFQGDEQ